MSLSTLYPTSRPSLLLDFVNRSQLDSRITFTRASSGTFFGSNGLLQTAANDVPRFDYDPVTRAARGLLIEEQRTNLLTRSEEFDNAAWGKSEVTVTPNVGIAPNGTLTADLLAPNATNALHGVQIAGVVAVSTTYTASVFAKAAGETTLIFANDGSGFATFNLSTGVASQSGLASPTVSMQNVGDGWWRCIATFTSGAGSLGNFALRLRMNGAYLGDGASGVLIWGAQLEAGAFATSYIPTTSATVIRSMDVASMTGTNFSSWFHASEGTILSEAMISGYTVPAANFPLIASLNDGTGNNYIENGYVTAMLSSFVVRSGNVEQAGLYPSAGSVQQRRVASAYRLNDFAVSANGGTVQTDTSGTVPTVDRLRLGERLATSGTSVICLNGHIRRIAYYPSRLTNAQLQALTAS